MSGPHIDEPPNAASREATRKQESSQKKDRQAAGRVATTETGKHHRAEPIEVQEKR